MDIFERIEKNKIEGMTTAQLHDILSYNDRNVSVSYVIQNHIKLSNNKLVKCIGCYYANMNGAKPKKDSSINSCFNTKKFFNINNVGSAYCCRECHLAMLRLLEEGEVKLK